MCKLLVAVSDGTGQPWVKPAMTVLANLLTDLAHWCDPQWVLAIEKGIEA